MSLNHRKIQEYLKALLEYYDFEAKLEQYISPSERIDVYGYSRTYDKTIGIEVSKTSDIKRDAEKLFKANFDLNFIVVDDAKYEMEIEQKGKKIRIIHYNNFESELRRILNISPSFPRFQSFEEWLRRTEVPKSIITTGKNLEKLIQTLEDSGVGEFVEDIVNTLAIVYIGKEIPSAYRDSVTYRLISHGVKTRRPEYVSTLDPKILSILKSFNLVFEEARGSGELRKYFVELTSEGKEIGREIIIRRISQHVDELRDLVKEFGKLAGIIAIGTIDRYGAEQTMRLELEPELEVIDELDRYMSRLVIDESVHKKLIRMGLKVDFGRSVKKTHPLILTFCHFLTYYKHNDSLKLFKELERLGLAVEVPRYDSKGRYIGMEIWAPIEVSKFLTDNCKLAFDDRILREFGALAIIYSMGKSHVVARERFEEYMRFLEIPLDAVSKVLEELNKLGLTSKYVSIPESAPFLVLNQQFHEEIRRKIYGFAESFLIS